MHKFYWNNTQRSGATSSSVASNATAPATSSQKISLAAENCQADQYNMDLSAVNIRHGHPEVPARAYGATASIKIEQRDQRATTPSGSHRVLLKLKKMSNRPKSMHENDQQSSENEAANVTTTTKSKLPSSKSMHQFYNRTWNERSLSKYANSREAGNSHNYENVYSNNYDDYFGSQATRSDNCDGCVINQLTCSPRSGRRGFAPPQPDYSVPPVPPERKGRGRKRAEKPLFRSKSCERPKMRDTFRVGSEKFAANFNRISSNITDKILHFQQENPNNGSEMSREISTVSNNSILQSVALRAIPCVDIQGSSQNGSGGGHYYRDSRDRERPPTKSPSSDHDLDNISDLSMPTRPPTASSNSSTTSRPSLALAHKMKGIRKDMQQKISRLRSRSAERISKRILHRQKSSNDNDNLENSESEKQTEIEDQKPVFRMNRSFSGLPMYNQVHNGPFIGRARALVDYTPSPYDRDALRFNRGDTIEIIAMNPSGLWQGKSQGRIGHFKFINVELLPDRNTLRQQRRSASEKVPNYTNSGPPKTVEELLKRIGLEEHLSVFVLNGYEELENFHDLDESELDYLGITENEQRAKILAAVELLQDSNTSSAATISDDDETERNVITEDASQNQFERHKFPRDSGCFASSSPASDRSSQQSHSESGIHDFEMDESLPSIKQRSSPEKSAQVSQQRRSLRDRHTLNTHELQILNLNGSSSSPPNRKDSFEVLVEKYVTEKTPLEHGRVRDARSIFENGCN